MRRIILLLLCSVCLWSCASSRRYLGPTAKGYEFHAIAIPDQIWLPSDVVSPENFPTSATLTVQVRDVNQAPVEGVPVMFQYAGSECQGVITLSAQRAVTLQGRVSVTLTTANTTGSCRLAVRVDNVTQDLWVAVSSPPEPFDRR
jgi:hypothetical protein